MSDIHDYGDEEPRNQGPAANFREQASSKFIFTWLPDQFADEQQRFRASPEEFVDFLQTTTAPNKATLPWAKLAVLGPTPSPAGSYRYDANVVALCGAEGDYDGTEISIEDAAALIQAAAIEAILNETTTPGHWRIWLPTSRDYRGSTDELRTLRARWVARINGVLGGILARESFVLSQAFYVGGIEGRPPIKVITTEGVRIDLRDDLDAGARYPNGKSEPARHHERAPVPDDLEESDDDPELLAECERIVADFVRTQGAGTTGTGDRAYRLINWIADLRTSGDLIASASMIFDVIHEDFPKTTLAFIEEKLSESDRQGARGCRLIGGEVEDEDEPAENEDAPDAGEPEASEEEVAEEPRPFLPDPAAHLAAVDERKAELKRILRDALLSETAVKLLINATMGLGKTYSSMEAIAATAGPPPPPAASVVNFEEEAPTDDDDPLKLDLSTVGEDLGHPRCVTRTNQVVFAAQRHDLLKEAAGFLRDALRERGWPDDVIDANIVIGQSRERGLCFRTDEELKMVTQAHGDIRPSLCVNRKGIRCPHFSECKVSGWLAMKDKMATSRFVFLTHAHLFSPWAAPGKPGERFHPAHAKLVIVDENFASAAIESDPTSIRAGTFRIAPHRPRDPRH